MNWCESNTYHNLLAVYDDLLRQHAQLCYVKNQAQEAKNWQVVATLKQSSDCIWAICMHLYDCLYNHQDLDAFLKKKVHLANQGWNYDYRKMMQIACEEGYDEYACFFKELCNYAKKQEASYLKLAFPLDEQALQYQCVNCGQIYEKIDDEKGCPLCGKNHNFLIKRLF